MRLYIWHNIDHVSDAYHTDGGLVICTSENPQDVWDGYATANGIELSQLPEPNKTIKVSAKTPPFVDVFPNTGCC